MQVLILATGENEKLRPLSNVVPVSMLPVANRPVMYYVIELLARQGYKHMFVSLLGQADKIESFFESGQRWGVKLEYILQRDGLGTAGALKWARHSLQETFLVIPADILIDLDIAKLLQFHRSSGNAATMVVHSELSSASRIVAVDENDWLVQENEGHYEPNNTIKYGETGVYLFEPEVLNLIPSRTHFDIWAQLIPALQSSGKRVSCFVCTGRVRLLESFSDYQSAQFDALNLDVTQFTTTNHSNRTLNPRPPGRQIAKGVWTGRNNRIHPDARLVPPLLIGNNSWIGQGVELGPEVTIGSNVIIRNDTQIQNSTILDNTYIGQMLRLGSRIVHQNLIVDILSGEYVQLQDDLLTGPISSKSISRVTKRIFDLTIALLLLIFLMPIMIPLAAAAWLALGQVFHPIQCSRHQPMRKAISGKEIRPVQLMRFATRHKNGHAIQFGTWLEILDLHRLPELWNVLIGDMRIVGVKPLQVDDASQLDEEWQRKREECLPGFTGLWFTQSENDDNLDGILVMDAYYVVTNNWRMDLRLLMQTPSTWFHRVRSKGAFKRKVGKQGYGTN